MKTEEYNKDFYDKVADIYEKADGRRNAWSDNLIDRIEKLSQIAPRVRGKNIATDFGAGTGYLSKLLSICFDEVYALDISKEMLAKIKRKKIKTKLYPCVIPRSGVITTYAVLHHIQDYELLFKSFYNALEPKGIYYSDEDITKDFYNLFKPAVYLYRMFKQAHKRFGVTKEEFDRVEVHQKGVDHIKIKVMLENIGFKVEILKTMPCLRFIARKG